MKQKAGFFYGFKKNPQNVSLFPHNAKHIVYTFAVTTKSSNYAATKQKRYDRYPADVRRAKKGTRTGRRNDRRDDVRNDPHND